jgi:ABC-2 type transport system permease protein
MRRRHEVVVRMRAFRSLTWLFAKLALRDPTSVFFSLALAPALVILFGLAFGAAPVPIENGIAAMDHQLPAIAAWVFAMTGLFTVPIAVLTRRESGTLRRLQATPLRPATYIAADVLVHLAQALAGLALLFAVGVIGFGASPTGAPAAILAAALLGALAFLALGYALAAILPSSRSTLVVGNLLAMPMLFLSGATAPLEVMPQGVRDVAAFNPLLHAVTLLRGAWNGEPWSGLSVSVAAVVALFVVATAVAVARFRWEA